MTSEHNQEFQDLVGDIANSFNIDSGATNQAMMLYAIAQEKKNTNLIVRSINQKLDHLLTRIEELEGEVKKDRQSLAENLSDRDRQVLDFVEKNQQVDAESLAKEFNYRGRNAASSRLNKLYKEGKLGKIHRGRKVYYTANA